MNTSIIATFNLNISFSWKGRNIFLFEVVKAKGKSYLSLYGTRHNCLAETQSHISTLQAIQFSQK
jgi:hypothetical protein